MAKELPYFRFTVQEWQNGKISLESYELQGVFMSICGYYWLQDCCLSRTLLCKKFRGYENLVDELIELSILKFNKKTDEIEITFLNMQFDLLSKARQSKQKAGSIGGKQKSSNARAVLKQNPSYKDKDNDNDNNKDNNKEKDNVFQNSIEFLHPQNLEDNNQSLIAKKENTVLPGGRQLHKLNDYIKQNYPTVFRLGQLTDEQCEFIIKTYPKDLIIDKLDAMENKKDLVKKYKSSFLTLKSWLKLGMENYKAKDQSRLSKNLSVLQSALQTLNEREQDGIQ
jgi:hypothetical protein